MKIKFFNVGLGDSILIECDNSNVIIDCCKTDGGNPLVQYLASGHPKAIRYLILSHPHYDHYSGMQELIQFCIDNNIAIKYFLHTSAVEPRYLQFNETENYKSRYFSGLLEKIEIAKEGGIIHKVSILSDVVSLKLENEFILSCKLPSSEDIRKYCRKIDFAKGISLANCSKAANLLSTFILLSNEEKQMAFTSDCERDSLERLALDFDNEFGNLPIVFCQVPHHGSIANHSERFWNHLGQRGTNFAPISAGLNDSNKLPNREVVDYISLQNIKVECTNTVYGFYSYEAERRSKLLDGDSTLLVEGKGTDLEYTIT